MGVGGNVASDIVVGSGVMRVAPIGTTLPTLDGSVLPVVWPAGWVPVGYTDQGVELAYTPTFKDISVDEEMAPVDKKLTAEKAIISAILAQSTLVNIQRAISGSKLSSSVASNDTTVLKVGSSQLDNQLMIGFEGPCPGTQSTRVIIAYKAKAIGAVALKFQRTDKVVVNAEFEILADGSQPVGERLFKIVDIGAQIES